MAIAKSKNGHEIIEFPMGYKEDLPREKNPHVIWKEIGYKQVTALQAAELLGGKEIEMKGLKGKAGKYFDAFVFYNFETRKTEYKFIDRPKKPIEIDEETPPPEDTSVVYEEDIDDPYSSR